MSEQKESSVLFSLKELMNLEEDRIKTEEDAKAQQVRAAEEARAAAERAAIQAEESRIAAEAERRRLDEQRQRDYDLAERAHDIGARVPCDDRAPFGGFEPTGRRGCGSHRTRVRGIYRNVRPPTGFRSGDGPALPLVTRPDGSRAPGTLS